MIPNMILIFFILMQAVRPINATPIKKPRFTQATAQKTLNFMNNNDNLLSTTDQSVFIQSPSVYIQNINLNSPLQCITPGAGFNSLLYNNQHLNYNSFIHPYSFMNKDQIPLNKTTISLTPKRDNYNQQFNNQNKSITPKRSILNQQQNDTKRSRNLFPEIDLFTITSPIKLNMPQTIVTQIDLIDNDIIMEDESQSIIVLPNYEKISKNTNICKSCKQVGHTNANSKNCKNKKKTNTIQNAQTTQHKNNSKDIVQTINNKLLENRFNQLAKTKLQQKDNDILIEKETRPAIISDAIKNICKNCNQIGHTNANSKQCLNKKKVIKKESFQTQIDDAVINNMTPKNKKQCPHCGGNDHQRITNEKCPYKHKKAECPHCIAKNNKINKPSKSLDKRNPEAAGSLHNAAYATVDDYANIKEDDIGDMIHQCNKCLSFNFADEVVHDNHGSHFSLCCHNGKIKLPEFNHPPNEIKNLYTKCTKESKEFLQHIRNYNSACAFASMNCKLDSIMEKTKTQLFKLFGEVCHLVSKSLHPEDDQPRSYGQLFILDTELATEERMKNKANSKCDKNTMNKLGKFIHSNNPYAYTYRQMSEIELEEQKKSVIEGRPMINVHMEFKRNVHDDPRRYNVPKIGEIAVVFTGEDGMPPTDIDFKVFPKNPDKFSLTKLNFLSQHIDPMTYPLIHWYGEPGWRPGMQHELEFSTKTYTRVTMMQFYSYMIAVRNKVFSLLHSSGKLFHQYLCDAYTKAEANNLKYINEHQKEIHAEKYKGLLDYVKNSSDGPVGRVTILPSTFRGSQRNMTQNYQDAMSTVCKYGKPDLFLTVTCNPNWAEIKRNIQPNQTPDQRPDIITRVFQIKYKRIMNLIKNESIFGVPVAHVAVIEFQKRGLPHAHILIILRKEDKIFDSDKLDKLIKAQLPDPNDSRQEKLYKLVTKHMVHGPCGSLNPHSVCMENGSCTKEFPKTFRDETMMNSNGYPAYARPDNGITYTTTKNEHTITLDNKWIVPYNPFIILTFNTHSNLESCASVKSVKYLYKYVYKGYDSTNIVVTLNKEGNQSKDFNEIKQYLDLRYVSAHEATWRLFEFKMHQQSHTICRLAVHCENEQTVYFDQNNVEEALSKQEKKKTTLTAWFKLNTLDKEARQYLYREIPNFYTFKDNVWQPRKAGEDKNTIGRMYNASPSEGERYYLRLLLLHVKGATSFKDLRTYNGTTYNQFRAAALARGLLEDDLEWERCLNEAVALKMPNQLRQLFCTICVFCNPSDPTVLFEKFIDYLIEDYIHQRESREISINKCLIVFEEYFKQHGKSCTFFLNDKYFPDYSKVVDISDKIDLVAEKAIGESLKAQLNTDQAIAVNTILKAVDNKQLIKKAFFIDGPGGTGKTFVYNTVTRILRGKGKSIISVAWTGIASILLIDGRTVHNAFQIPLELDENSTSSIPLDSNKAKLIKAADLIVWDEAPMAPINALKAIDHLLQKIMKNHIPYGGKTIVLGGDFRQVTPVIPKASKAKIIENSIKNTINFKFQTLKLTTNMRADKDEREFADWLLKIGNAQEKTHNQLGEDLIEIPNEVIVKDDIIDDLYGDITDTENYKDICILSTKNVFVAELNERIQNEKIVGELHIKKSIDQCECDDQNEKDQFTPEYLNSLTPSGMPPHILNLKVGSIAMLMRNLNMKAGLCNGTRLIIRKINQNTIEVEIISGNKNHIGNRVLVPRIDLRTKGNDLPFTLLRRQFPIRLAFCMTINKSQGQTFKKIGLYLPQPVFSHGQLYVACSRTCKMKNLRIKISNFENKQGELLPNRYFTKNIVFEALIEKDERFIA